MGERLALFGPVFGKLILNRYVLYSLHSFLPFLTIFTQKRNSLAWYTVSDPRATGIFP
jgi:hypothetical protein